MWQKLRDSQCAHQEKGTQFDQRSGFILLYMVQSNAPNRIFVWRCAGVSGCVCLCKSKNLCALGIAI